MTLVFNEIYHDYIMTAVDPILGITVGMCLILIALYIFMKNESLTIRYTRKFKNVMATQTRSDIFGTVFADISDRVKQRR